MGVSWLNIDMKYGPNSGCLHFVKFSQIRAKIFRQRKASIVNIFLILVFHYRYFKHKATISAILTFHCKKFKHKANISEILAFYYKYFHHKADIFLYGIVIPVLSIRRMPIVNLLKKLIISAVLT